MKIPFARPMIGEEEIAEVVDTLRSGWLTTGPKTKRFEEEFARAIGVPHAVATSSCTGALHIALAALGVGREDEVLTSTMTFAATAHSIVHCGARPVFCDVEPGTLNVDVDDLEARLTPKTRAVVAVHYGGRPCDIVRLRRFCDAKGLILIEDAAHAMGAAAHGRSAGAWGDAGAFSFYANKNLTTGEGGMLTTSSAELLEKARILRLQGVSRDAFGRAQGPVPSWRYDIVAAGFKYPMSDIQAGIGIHQLRRFPGLQEARRRLASRYDQAMAALPGVVTLDPPAPDVMHAWHLYVVRVQRRDELFQALGEAGIECSVHFVPLHLHPYFQEAWGYRRGMFPTAEAAYREVLSLPLWPGLTDAMQDRVTEEFAALVTSRALR